MYFAIYEINEPSGPMHCRVCRAYGFGRSVLIFKVGGLLSIKGRTLYVSKWVESKSVPFIKSVDALGAHCVRLCCARSLKNGSAILFRKFPYKIYKQTHKHACTGMLITFNNEKEEEPKYTDKKIPYEIWCWKPRDGTDPFLMQRHTHSSLCSQPVCRTRVA